MTSHFYIDSWIRIVFSNENICTRHFILLSSPRHRVRCKVFGKYWITLSRPRSHTRAPDVHRVTVVGRQALITGLFTVRVVQAVDFSRKNPQKRDPPRQAVIMSRSRDCNSCWHFNTNLSFSITSTWQCKYLSRCPTELIQYPSFLYLRSGASPLSLFFFLPGNAVYSRKKGKCMIFSSLSFSFASLPPAPSKCMIKVWVTWVCEKLNSPN